MKKCLESKDILERDEIGERMFVEFAIERLTEGRLCVWDKMTKKKLKTFKTSNATIGINTAYGGKLVKIKEKWCSTTVSICVRWDSPVRL